MWFQTRVLAFPYAITLIPYVYSVLSRAETMSGESMSFRLTRPTLRVLGVDVAYALSPAAKGKVERPYPEYSL
jgi:hypothetical protein